MNTHHFVRTNEDDLVVIPCKIDGDKITLALDTGASHTTVDLTPLLLAGYSVSDAIGTEKIETASGIIEAHIFVVRRMECLGITRKNFKLSAYVFFCVSFFIRF